MILQSFLQGWIDDERVLELAGPLRNSGYGEYLIELLERGPEG